MKSSYSTARNVIAILAIPIVMLFLIVVTPFSLGIASPFDLCGMVDAGSRATSLSFICRGVLYEDAIPTGFGGQSCRCSVRSTDVLPTSTLNLKR